MIKSLDISLVMKNPFQVFISHLFIVLFITTFNDAKGPWRSNSFLPMEERYQKLKSKVDA